MLDTLLTITSKRDHRDFSPTEIPASVTELILDAGRLAGSARNLQPWRFLVATSETARGRLAAAVYVPQLVRTAPLVIAIAAETRFSQLALMDAGRAAQNMMLAAWSEGVASCPNGVADPQPLTDLGVLSHTEVVPLVLSFGYPAAPRQPNRRSPADWSARANRRQLRQLVVHLDDARQAD